MYYHCHSKMTKCFIPIQQKQCMSVVLLLRCSPYRGLHWESAFSNKSKPSQSDHTTYSCNGLSTITAFVPSSSHITPDTLLHLFQFTCRCLFFYSSQPLVSLPLGSLLFTLVFCAASTNIYSSPLQDRPPHFL